MSGREKRAARSQTKSPVRGKPPSRTKSKSPGRKYPARTKSPARPKTPVRQKSPGRPKSPGQPKSPARKSKSPAPKRQASRTTSPKRIGSPVRQSSVTKQFISTVENSINDKILRRSPFISIERTTLKSTKSDDQPLENEGDDGDMEVLFIEDDVRYKTSPLNVKFGGGKLNVGDVRQVKWKDGLYYDARILSLSDVSRERSVSVPKASTSAQITSRTYTTEETLVRRSSRLKRDEELESQKSGVDKILKANNTPLPPQYERKYGEKPVREFGSWPGALLSILALPAVALILQMSCTKSKCYGVATPSLNWKTYLDAHAASYVVGFVALQAVLSSLPVGRTATYGILKVRLTGFYSAVLTLAGLAGLYYSGYNVTSVLGKTVALLTAAILTAVILALALFIKGGRPHVQRNLNADGNKVYDYFIGRELNPTVGPLVIKALITRVEFIAILLLDALYLLKYTETHAAGVYSPTLLFVVAAHTVQALDTLWFEEQFMTTFLAQCDGVGHMNVMAAAVWPFLLTLSTRTVLNTGYEAPTWLLATCGVLFSIGYFLYRASNSQKAEFRKNPQHPVFAKYNCISTFHGRKLLNESWWGMVRHPNYVGDMCMMWSVAGVIGLAHWLPYVFPALHSAVLIHRTFRVGRRCQTLYGAAWDRYTQHVKYRLIPRLF